MNTQTSHNIHAQPDYGIDAPGVRQGMFIAGLTGLLTATALGLNHALSAWMPGNFRIGALILSLLVAMYGLFMGSYMTWVSRVGKLQTRQRLLDIAGQRLNWTGREAALDVGCGRGLMLIGVALRLKQGVAIGIDLWRAEDQTNNTPEAAEENARRSGVADKVCIDTGDARDMPYPDNSFDLVVSHCVVHNLPDRNERLQVLDEMLRVLRPGGVLALADIEHMRDYGDHLLRRGALNLQVLDGGVEAAVMGVLSGGSYRPQALIAQKIGTVSQSLTS